MLIDILRVLPQLLSNLRYLIDMQDGAAAAVGTILSLLILLVYIVVLRYALFKADKLVDKLALDKNFSEEKFDLNIHRSTVVKIAVIIVGGVTLVNSFVPFLLNLYAYIKSKNNPAVYETSAPEPLTMVMEFILVLLGYFLLTNSRFIVNLVERERRKG